MEPITTSNQLLLLEAIDRVRNDVDDPRLPLEELTETTFTLVAEHMSLTQIIKAAEGLIELASHPSRPKQAPPMPVDELQALLEKVIDLRDWQELEEDDDRNDIQKLIDNATDADAVLVKSQKPGGQRQFGGLHDRAGRECGLMAAVVTLTALEPAAIDQPMLLAIAAGTAEPMGPARLLQGSLTLLLGAIEQLKARQRKAFLELNAAARHD